MNNNALVKYKTAFHSGFYKQIKISNEIFEKRIRNKLIVFFNINIDLFTFTLLAWYPLKSVFIERYKDKWDWMDILFDVYCKSESFINTYENYIIWKYFIPESYELFIKYTNKLNWDRISSTENIVCNFAFNEDLNRNRNVNAVQNFSCIDRIALNFLKKDDLKFGANGKQKMQNEIMNFF